MTDTGKKAARNEKIYTPAKRETNITNAVRRIRLSFVIFSPLDTVLRLIYQRVGRNKRLHTGSVFHRYCAKIPIKRAFPVLHNGLRTAATKLCCAPAVHDRPFSRSLILNRPASHYNAAVIT